MNPRRQPWMQGHLVVFNNGIERHARDIRPAYSIEEQRIISATDLTIIAARNRSLLTHLINTGRARRKP